MGDVVEFTRAADRHEAERRAPRPAPIAGGSKPLWRHAVGEVLRVERLGQERILTEVAATAGVSPQYLSEVERGRKEPSSEVLGSVADALGLELVDVVQRVGSLLGERREDERRDAERRELLRVETSFAFRADAVDGEAMLVIDVNGAELGTSGHPLVVVEPGGRHTPAGPSAYLLVA